MDLEVARVPYDHPDFVALAQRLTEFLAVLNGETDGFYRQHNRSDSLPYVVVAYRQGAPVGCGALRPKTEMRIEIKRMFTDPEVRGTGVGIGILTELEGWAQEMEFAETVLETSPRLESAVRLYERAGYRRIPNYPPYEGLEDSWCFGKWLTPSV